MPVATWRRSRLALTAAVLVLFSACEPAMNHEAKLRPYTFQDHLPDGIVERATPGKTSLLSREGLLKRGQSRFNIYCAPCHGDDAEGHGMIVQHGFLNPPSLHRKDILEKPLQFYVDVITQGYGAMYSYADRLNEEDRWAVANYIRALQLSQSFPYKDLSNDEKRQVGAP